MTTYSHSRLETYENCPFKYKLQYIDRVRRDSAGIEVFRLIAVAALFSTASAINATLFGGANTSYVVAKEGELPEIFERKSWKSSPDGLFITAGLVIAFVLLFDLRGIAMMGSGAFLIVYAAVSAGHLRIAAKTGANRTLLVVAVALCLGMLVLLTAYMYKQSKPSFAAMFIVLVASFLAELVYRKVSGRHLKTLSEGEGSLPPLSGWKPRSRYKGGSCLGRF